jgi:hypothetical protein
MAASVTSVSASPATVAPGGATSTITPAIANPDQTAAVSVAVDGSTGSASVVLHEGLTFTVDQTKLGVKGYVVATLSPASAGTLAVAANGTSFTFTSA